MPVPLASRAALAYFITFHTYGTWLPGDPRGSVDRNHNGPGHPYFRGSAARYASCLARLRHPPVELAPDERGIVLGAIHDVCHHRGWLLSAAHVRMNHVHVVVRAEHSPERVMNDLKAWSTRRIMESGHRPRGSRVWVRHGSTRYLWRTEDVAAAVAYVVEGQGGESTWATTATDTRRGAGARCCKGESS